MPPVSPQSRLPIRRGLRRSAAFGMRHFAPGDGARGLRRPPAGFTFVRGHPMGAALHVFVLWVCLRAMIVCFHMLCILPVRPSIRLVLPVRGSVCRPTATFHTCRTQCGESPQVPRRTVFAPAHRVVVLWAQEFAVPSLLRMAPLIVVRWRLDLASSSVRFVAAPGQLRRSLLPVRWSSSRANPAKPCMVGPG